MKGVTEERSYNFDVVGSSLSGSLHLSIGTDVHGVQQIAEDSITISLPDFGQSISINLAEAVILIGILQRCLELHDDVAYELGKEKDA